MITSQDTNARASLGDFSHIRTGRAITVEYFYCWSWDNFKISKLSQRFQRTLKSRMALFIRRKSRLLVFGAVVWILVVIFYLHRSDDDEKVSYNIMFSQIQHGFVWVGLQSASCASLSAALYVWMSVNLCAFRFRRAFHFWYIKLALPFLH